MGRYFSTGEDFEAGFCYEDVVLDADAEFSGDVDARLDGNDLACLEYVFRF